MSYNFSMKKILLTLLIFTAASAFFLYFIQKNSEASPNPNNPTPPNEQTTTTAEITKQATTSQKIIEIKNPEVNFVNLPVPFTPEAPDGLMVKPWNNSCEEASTVMLDEFYLGNTNARIPKEKAKKMILRYIGIENKIFGYNANTNSKEIVKLIIEYSKYFEARIVANPTLDDIKEQLKNERPIIALLNGRKLENPRINFAVNGSYYHTFVIKGFDEEKKEFIVNDNGDLKQGLDLRYGYDTILGALADYNHKLGKTVAPPTVIFTKQRILVKTANSGRIYLITDNEKHHVTSPAILKDNGWKWNMVLTVEKEWLNKFSEGYPI